MKDIPCDKIRVGDVCTCFPKKCDDVDMDTCIAIRCAFRYGFSIAENIAHEKFEEIKANPCVSYVS